MKRFVIFFTEKEGTCALVRLLDKLQQVSILRQDSGKEWQAWEPFDTHGSGALTFGTLEYCLDQLFTYKEIDFSKLNNIYSKKSKYKLLTVKPTEALGFKMRFTATCNPFYVHTGELAHAKIYNRCTQKMFSHVMAKPFKSMMFNLLSKNNVTVFFAVRQDLLRWGLSKYRSDYYKGPKHLQFDLARGIISPNDIIKMTVDCGKLEKIIRQCENVHRKRVTLMAEMQQRGITVIPLRYEDFLLDKHDYLRRFSDSLALSVTDGQIQKAVSSKPYFIKVNSNHISDIVTNYQEVERMFKDRFFSW